LIDLLIDYEQKANTSPNQVLRDLRQANHSNRLREWLYGVCLQIAAASFLQHPMQQPEATPASTVMSGMWMRDPTEERRINSDMAGTKVLQPGVPGTIQKPSCGSETRWTSAPGQETSETQSDQASLLAVRDNQETGGSPRGRRCDEQRRSEPQDTLLAMPPDDTQDRWMQSSRMWQSALCEGILQQALPAFQESWERAIDVLNPRETDSCSSVVKCNVGGGVMGHRLAHVNEAPFPEALAAFFVRSCCPPDGLVLDPFSGSGTTASVCRQHNRNCIGLDLRESQVELAKRRTRDAQPRLLDT
jgi:hypothetical protein